MVKKYIKIMCIYVCPDCMNGSGAGAHWIIPAISIRQHGLKNWKWSEARPMIQAHGVGACHVYGCRVGPRWHSTRGNAGECLF